MITWDDVRDGWSDVWPYTLALLVAMSLFFVIADCYGGVKEPHVGTLVSRRYEPPYVTPGYTTTEHIGKETYVHYHPPVYHPAEYYLTVALDTRDDGTRTFGISGDLYGSLTDRQQLSLACRRGHWTRHLYCDLR